MATEVEVEYERNEDFMCGIRKWRPRFLQKFTTIYWFLPFISIFSLIQGLTVNGLIAAAIPHIEREFGFTSTDSGILLAANDLSGFIFVLFVSYYGEKGHKPVWLGIGSIMTGLGAFMFSLPKFIKGPYLPIATTTKSFDMQPYEICSSNNTATNINFGDACNTSHGSGLYLAIFCIANMLMGLGTTPLNTLGVAYLDENVSPKNSPIFIGTWYLMTLLGPSIGLSAASGFLKQYTDPNKDVGNLSPMSPIWVGRWWLPFSTISWILVVNGFILVLFPKMMPGAAKMRQKATEKGEIAKESAQLEDNRKDGFLGFLKSTIFLMKNKYLMLMLLAGSSKFFIAAGISPFFPKLLIEKYGADFATVNSIVGVVLILGAIVGLTSGSLIMRSFNIRQSVKKATALSILLGVLNVGLGFSFITKGCDNINLVDYNLQVKSTNGTMNCNSHCGCSKTLYKPVCKDETTFLSPCFAGCTVKGNQSNYLKCACVQGDTSPINTSSSVINTFGQQVVRIGKCDQNCQNVYVFSVFIFFIIMTSFLGITPKNMITLRSVPANQRSFAMGLQFVLARFLGMLPGPIVVGQIFDSSCMVWKYDQCGRKTNCAEYELDKLSMRLSLLSVFGHVANLVLLSIAMRIYEGPDVKVSSQESVMENKRVDEESEKHHFQRNIFEPNLQNSDITGV